jgi:NAD(P)-dependent dehydrogenase (short-subunit alcohol dehydrogenase family)
MNTVVVTGVSSGIGAATAAVLARAGFKVFGSVRRPEDATALKAEFGEAFQPLIFDVTDEAAIAAAAGEVRAGLAGTRLAGLVNNAGASIAGPLALQPVEDFRRQIEINLVGPFLVTQAFAPLLGTDPALTGPPGRIVNISSVGGKMAAPFIGAYAVTKHGLEAYSESLRRELQLFGVDVIIIGPGAVVTPIWDKAEAAGIGPYAGTPYEAPMRAFSAWFLEQGRRQGYPPAKVAEVVLTALTTPRPRVRYAVVPKPMMNWIVPRLLPKRMVDRTMGKAIGLLPKS